MFGKPGQLFLAFAVCGCLIHIESAVFLADEEEGISVCLPDRVEVMSVEFCQLGESAVVVEPYVGSAGRTFVLAPYVLETLLVLIEHFA